MGKPPVSSAARDGMQVCSTENWFKRTPRYAHLSMLGVRISLTW